MFQQNLHWRHSMMMQVTEFLPGLPPLSIITVVGLCLMATTAVLYLLSRMPELLLIAVISCIYAMVPMMGMLKHL